MTSCAIVPAVKVFGVEQMPAKDGGGDTARPENGRRKMLPYRVFVAGAPCDIAVYSSVKAGSVAVGEYRGMQIEVRATHALEAAEAWARAANKFSQRNSPQSP